jgi:uncharacterized protein YjiS (DUF1127 family)
MENGMTLLIDDRRKCLDSRMPSTRPAVLAGLRIGFAVLARLAARIAESHRKRRAIRDLQTLDDRILKDIGISRSEILYYIHGPASSGERTASVLTRER